MEVLLVLAVIVLILFIAIEIKLFLKVKSIIKKIKYLDDANMWYKLAVTDELTGVNNRNAYNLAINKFDGSTKGETRGIILFDVDDFKIINDTRGHLAGDIVLRNVA